MKRREFIKTLAIAAVAIPVAASLPIPTYQPKWEIEILGIGDLTAEATFAPPKTITAILYPYGVTQVRTLRLRRDGKLVAEKTTSPINMITGDSLSVTWDFDDLYKLGVNV